MRVWDMMQRNEKNRAGSTWYFFDITSTSEKREYRICCGARRKTTGWCQLSAGQKFIKIPPCILSPVYGIIRGDGGERP